MPSGKAGRVTPAPNYVDELRATLQVSEWQAARNLRGMETWRIAACLATVAAIIGWCVALAGGFHG